MKRLKDETERLEVELMRLKDELMCLQDKYRDSRQLIKLGFMMAVPVWKLFWRKKGE